MPSDQKSNLSYIPRDWSWYDAYKSTMGFDALSEYTNRVYRFLTDMPPDSFFRLEDSVKPENTDLFIKVCCRFISEHAYMPGRTDDYEFNADATVLRRIRNHPGEKKKTAGKPVHT